MAIRERLKLVNGDSVIVSRPGEELASKPGCHCGPDSSDRPLHCAVHQSIVGSERSPIPNLVKSKPGEFVIVLLTTVEPPA